jgi:hypothetical protein
MLSQPKNPTESEFVSLRQFKDSQSSAETHQNTCEDNNKQAEVCMILYEFFEFF